MENIAKLLVAAAALAFLLAVVGVFGLRIIDVQPESFSRAANNLTLIGIALWLMFKKPVAGA